MKWTHPKFRDTRQQASFLWLPKRIGHLTRWLEFACWREEYRELRVGAAWIPTHWVRTEEGEG